MFTSEQWHLTFPLHIGTNYRLTQYVQSNQQFSHYILLKQVQFLNIIMKEFFDWAKQIIRPDFLNTSNIFLVTLYY